LESSKLISQSQHVDSQSHSQITPSANAASHKSNKHIVIVWEGEYYNEDNELIKIEKMESDHHCYKIILQGTTNILYGYEMKSNDKNGNKKKCK